jgi:MoxR-like ATPase
MKLPRKLDYQYIGDDAYQPEMNTRDPQGRRYDPYVAGEDLKEAVNLAIALKRPLLLEGEPGCGKTRLAGAIAYELTQKNFKELVAEDGQPVWWDYYIWTVKSTLRARDGLYRYDAVARLRDAQLIGSDPKRLQEYIGKEESDELKERLKDKKSYREMGALGEALRDPQYRSIVLIDEIDKADSDFPNDLLTEIDQLRFEIPETGERFETPDDDKKPIIIVTSNREKPLPEPFLRRCLYFYVEFPAEAQLREIITKRFGVLRGKDKLISEAIAHFYEVREMLIQQPGSRPPGTSEFLEFLTALSDRSVKNAKEDIQNLANRLPLLGILLKTKSDQDLYRKNFSSKRNG